LKGDDSVVAMERCIRNGAQAKADGRILQQH